MTDVSVEVRGLEELQKKTEQVIRDLEGSEFVRSMSRATLIVERDAKINAPVDTGRLRASILPEIRQQIREVQGVVGSNVVYAAFQERLKHYLQRAVEDNVDRIVDLIGEFVARIVAR